LNRVVIVDGDMDYVNSSQILRSRRMKELLAEVLRRREGITDEVKLQDTVKEIIIKLSRIIVGFNEEESDEDKRKLIDLLEETYNVWREKHRFMIKRRKYEKNTLRRMYLEYQLARTADDFANLIRSTYRDILYHIEGSSGRILRQLPSGVQAAFLMDKLKQDSNIALSNPTLYDVYFLWSGILYPPVIFETMANKRKGIFKFKKERILERVKLDSKSWYGLPIYVGDLLFLIYTHENFLAQMTALLNLFEIPGLDEIKSRRVNAIVLFGVPLDLVEEDEKNGVAVWDEKEHVYVGLIPGIPENDYFGYMKKMTLTLHNMIQIDRGFLPVHGAVARIKSKDRELVICMVGDSGAGKSETLDALSRLEGGDVEVEIIVDDMASLRPSPDGVVVIGTETGAFVRLDDLPRAYAYSTMDRSIFMNPGLVNSRVVVPFGNYDVIIKPTKVDMVLYANNHERMKSEKDVLRRFNDIDSALRVFSEGKRIAKSTTHEKGITKTYFANPFGAIQRREEHEIIARRIFELLFSNNIFVGEILTQLGIPGMEVEGPRIAATALLKFLKGGNKVGSGNS